jgi:hypothetical protein
MSSDDTVKRAAGCFSGTLCKAFREFGYEVQRLIDTRKKSEELFIRMLSMIVGKRPKYYRTGITPKWSNRTRKKQRLTRLQRRHKRQRK